MILPAYMIATLSQMLATMPRSCVIRIMAVPSLSLSSLIIAST